MKQMKQSDLITNHWYIFANAEERTPVQYRGEEGNKGSNALCFYDKQNKCIGVFPEDLGLYIFEDALANQHTSAYQLKMVLEYAQKMATHYMKPTADPMDKMNFENSLRKYNEALEKENNNK